jgi:peptide/nickel transport system permease protein
MLLFALRRTLASLPVIASVSVLAFLFLRKSGDPAAEMAGEDATAERVEAIREALGLNRPLAEQFLDWIWRMGQGDFGRSLVSNDPVARMVGERLEATVSLALTTTILSVLVAVPLGLVAARWRGTWLDRAVTTFCVGGFSVPSFVVGYLLVWLFSIRLGWMPAQGYVSVFEDPGQWLLRLTLPTVAMSTVFVVLIARITRASVIETLDQDYIRTARALGAGETRVFLRFALRNAAVPIVTIIGVGFGVVLTGVVVTETVFNLPGLGRLTVEAVLARDFPVIQSVVLLFSLAYVAINLAVDVAYAALDPRIRY